MSRVSLDEETFHKLLTVLATRCRTELDSVEIGILDRHLAPYGYPAVNAALEKLIVERATNDPFPSIRKVLEIMGKGELSERSLAVDVTNKIAVLIRRKGRYWAHDEPDMRAALIKEIGEVGADVVKRLGGWQAVIEMSDENPRNYQLSIKETALATIEAKRQSDNLNRPALGAPSRKMLAGGSK
jgi:hypothetical protein